MSFYVPGSYEVFVTGTSGDQSAIISFTFVLIDPCPTANLSFSSTFANISKELRYPTEAFSWGSSIATTFDWQETIILQDISTVCGPVQFSAFSQDGGSLDS